MRTASARRAPHLRLVTSDDDMAREASSIFEKVETVLRPMRGIHVPKQIRLAMCSMIHVIVNMAIDDALLRVGISDGAQHLRVRCVEVTDAVRVHYEVDREWLTTLPECIAHDVIRLVIDS